MTADALWLTEADVTAALSLREAVTVLEQGLLAEARGEAVNLDKTHATWGDGHTLHALGATFVHAGFAGTKTWAHTAGGASPLLILFDARTGAVRAVIEAFALGQMRTGGMSGVATRWLAPEAADTLAVIGSGKQAFTQVAAVAVVRPLATVRVFSPTAQHRAAFAQRLRAELACDVLDCGTLADAVAGAAIITLVTRAARPFLTTDLVPPGSHLNAVGAITPERAEFTPDVLERCDRICADSVSAVQRLSREFGEAFFDDDWTRVEPLCDVVAAQRARRPHTDVSLFKAMGTGIADLALGIEVFQRAGAAGLGRPIPPPQRAKLRLQP